MYSEENYHNSLKSFSFLWSSSWPETYAGYHTTVLERDADINVSDDNGATPLDNAVRGVMKWICASGQFLKQFLICT